MLSEKVCRTGDSCVDILSQQMERYSVYRWVTATNYPSQSYWEVAQFGRAPDLGSGGRGFESRLSNQDMQEYANGSD